MAFVKLWTPRVKDHIIDHWSFICYCNFFFSISWPISFVITIGPIGSEELLYSIGIRMLNSDKSNKKLLNQNGREIWSTTHHDQSFYQIWKQDGGTDERTNKQTIRKAIYAPILSYAGHKNRHYLILPKSVLCVRNHLYDV